MSEQETQEIRLAPRVDRLSAIGNKKAAQPNGMIGAAADLVGELAKLASDLETMRDRIRGVEENPAPSIEAVAKGLPGQLETASRHLKQCQKVLGDLDAMF